MRSIAGTLLLLLICSVCHPVIAQVRWQAYSSEISFKIKNAGIIVSGTFEGLKADLVFDPEHPSTSHLGGTVDASTISTGINARNNHLRKQEYFYVEKFPLIQVSSVSISGAAPRFTGIFNVTIRGVTRRVEFPFEFTEDKDGATFSGSFEMNRRDFGVGGSSLFMADDVSVSILVHARR